MVLLRQDIQIKIFRSWKIAYMLTGPCAHFEGVIRNTIIPQNQLWGIKTLHCQSFSHYLFWIFTVDTSNYYRFFAMQLSNPLKMYMFGIRFMLHHEKFTFFFNRINTYIKNKLNKKENVQHLIKRRNFKLGYGWVYNGDIFKLCKSFF